MSNDNKIITLNNLTAFKDELDGELNNKQDVIDNLPEIIEGAQAGATAVQPRDLSFTYSETFSVSATITNGTITTSIPNYIEGDEMFVLSFTASSDYIVPMTFEPSSSEILVSGASFSYEYDGTAGDYGSITLFNIESDVTVEIVCRARETYTISSGSPSKFSVYPTSVKEYRGVEVELSVIEQGTILDDTASISGATSYSYSRNSDYVSAAATISGVFENVVVTVSTSTLPLVTGASTGCTINDGSSTTYSEYIYPNSTSRTIYLNPQDGYTMPEYITVNKSTGTSGSGAADWSYVNDKGTYTLYLENISDNVSFSVDANPKVFSITTSVSNGSYSGDSSVTYHSSATVVISADTGSGYVLPQKITVDGETGTSGHGYAVWTYDSTTGVISLSNAEGPISISATCQKNWSVSGQLSDCTINGNASYSGNLTYDDPNGLELTIVPSASGQNTFVLPLSITVNGHTGTAGNTSNDGVSWTYNSTTGVVTLWEPTNDVTFSVTGIKQYSLTGQITNGVFSDESGYYDGYVYADLRAVVVHFTPAGPSPQYFPPVEITVNGTTGTSGSGWVYDGANRTITFTTANDTTFDIVCVSSYSITGSLVGGTINGSSSYSSTIDTTPKSLQVVADNGHILPLAITVNGVTGTSGNEYTDGVGWSYDSSTGDIYFQHAGWKDVVFSVDCPSVVVGYDLTLDLGAEEMASGSGYVDFSVELLDGTTSHFEATASEGSSFGDPLTVTLENTDTGATLVNYSSSPNSASSVLETVVATYTISNVVSVLFDGGAGDVTVGGSSIWGDAYSLSGNTTVNLFVGVE